EQALDTAAAAANKAANLAREAAQRLDAARLEHRAHELAVTLTAGEPCPVCRAVVTSTPEVEEPADLNAAQQALDAALVAQSKSEKARSDAAEVVAAVRAKEEALVAQLETTTALVADHPDVASVQRAIAGIANAERALAAARKAASDARARAKQARDAAAGIDKLLAEARRDLDAARDSVASLAPPVAGHVDLGADWNALASWAAERSAAVVAEVEAAKARALEAEQRGKAIVATQREACIAAGIEDVTSPRDDCLKAIERAKGFEQQIELGLETAKQLREEIVSLEERTAVARTLGAHLKASAFERWILRQALSTLTEGATQLLLELSNGQYSLTLDKGFNFAVVDHRNANLERSAKTLSGGEKFLASLALALALSDRIAQLSANTAVRLESIFLDEGFGSLDSETLETVATALENLSNMHRVVGIVTHVRDLAERVPVRFEVRKGPSTSHVEKVHA
ncbi:MAG TPA: SbcC/MukB-like Walker B domain-containing protein, partial [Actinomycetota bacterium]|nr:SbcC/MukB-like Walker B domain-containing protein [Actinomycetota bacterium]